jgi:putative SOS response-associated peptidase YedK
MCGRLSLTTSAKVISDHFQLRNGLYLKPRYNIAPFQPIPVIKKPHHIDFLNWGFLPLWLKNSKGFINARIETISQKPSFRRAMEQRRCLIVTDGYYEWKQEGSVKKPYYISRRDKNVFALAGIWEEETCAVLTTIADTRFFSIHDRMPIVVPESLYLSWLNPHVLPEKIISMLPEFHRDDFECYAVSTKVNNVNFESVDCLLPLVSENA